MFHTDSSLNIKADGNKTFYSKMKVIIHRTLVEAR